MLKVPNEVDFGVIIGVTAGSLTGWLGGRGR